MKIEYLNIDDLKICPWNPRKFPDEMMDRLVKSLKEYGFVEPVIINKNNVILGGNHRKKAAEKIGLKTIPCYRVDLPKNKEKALNVALNKIQGEWNFPMLKDLIVEIDTGEFDIELTGFNEEELKNMFDWESLEIPNILDMKEPIKNGNEEFILHIIFDNEAQMQTLFEELNNRGYTVKR